MYSEELLRIGSRKLKKCKINTSRLDSEILLSNLTGKSREFLIINPSFKIKNSHVKLFMIENKNQLARYLKQNMYGKKIVVGMGAGSISSWIKELPNLMK